MAINSLGVRKVLLTDQEAHCYKVACAYQRKNLIHRLLQLKGPTEFYKLLHLKWSSNILKFLFQLLALLVVFPFAALWLTVRKFIELLIFPFVYTKTFFVPNDLAAPGEKTLLGVHHAFSRYMDVGLIEYIHCLNDWIKILYGEEVLRKLQLEGFLDAELQRLEMDRKDLKISNFSPTTRSIVANAREKISRKLGHYGKGK